MLAFRRRYEARRCAHGGGLGVAGTERDSVANEIEVILQCRRNGPNTGPVSVLADAHGLSVVVIVTTQDVVPAGVRQGETCRTPGSTVLVIQVLHRRAGNGSHAVRRSFGHNP